MYVIRGSDVEGTDDEVLDLGFEFPSATVRPVCLVGKLCAEKSPNVFALTELMLKAFKPKGKLSARE
ncbi:hypothetical protein ACS0TY_001270 [Phlomoides rotata]